MAIRPISKIAMSVACQHGAMLQHWQVTDIATVLIRRGECINIDTVADVGYECSTHAQHQPSMKSATSFFGRGAWATGNIAMLWIIALQQPLAKSVHPLHVRSWERHGADEDMQETLKHFAAFCGQSPSGACGGNPSYVTSSEETL